MKSPSLYLSVLAVAGSIAFSAETALAQEKVPKAQEQPVPDSSYPEDQMPIKKTDTSPLPMPSPRMWGMTHDPKTGEISTYTDSKTGLRYDFDKNEITDYQTGKVYEFAERGKNKLPERGPEKQPRQPKQPSQKSVQL